MKKLLIPSILLLFWLSESYTAKAQCRDFARTVGISELDTTTYIHDGRYNAIQLREGEEVQLYKTLHSGYDYRVVVCGSNDLPEIPFKVLDFKRNVIYDSSEHKGNQHKYPRKWDFTSKSTQRIIISVTVPEIHTDDASKQNGCISVMFGFKK